jgi:hypothetical protein
LFGGKLAIELNGDGHNYRLGQMRDKSRSNVLADQDMIVLRFGTSSSVRTRQRLESILVCVGEKAFVATTLTLILSLPMGEADFVQRRRNKRGGTSKCEITAQAVASKSQKS